MTTSKLILWAVAGSLGVVFIYTYWQVLLVLLGILGLWSLFEHVHRSRSR